MRNDHPPGGDLRRDVRQPLGDVLVREPMKAIAAHALRHRTAPGSRSDRRRRCARDGRRYRSRRPAAAAESVRRSRGSAPDCWADAAAPAEHIARGRASTAGIDQDRPVVVGAAMHDPVPDRDRIDRRAARAARRRPCARPPARRRPRRARSRRSIELAAISTARAQPRSRADAVHLALDQTLSDQPRPRPRKPGT